MPALLTDAEVADRLRHLRGWKHEAGFLTRSFEFKGFMEGIAFINSVARIAEKEEHHPDIGVRYTKITLSIQTHSEGGVTEWDFGLAEKIEDFLREGHPRKGRQREPGAKPGVSSA